MGDLPTPVDRLEGLDDGQARLWVKRDDLSSRRYGGSKVRKLEWVLHNPPYAERDGARPPILSMGAFGSHHLLALALFCETLGQPIHALVVDQTPTAHARTNLAVMASLGVSFWHERRRIDLGRAWLRYRAQVEPRDRGVWMGAGASTPLGCFGYVDAGLELGGQIDAGLCPRPAVVYITAGSAGAGAGLVLGLALAGVSTHVVLVSAVEPWYFNRALFALKAAAAWRALAAAGLEAAQRSSWRAAARTARLSWGIDHRFVGGGYAVPTRAGAAAVRRAAEAGLRLEPTYTAKSLAATLDDARRGRSVGDVLWWNTHGANDLEPLIRPNWTAALPDSLYAAALGHPRPQR